MKKCFGIIALVAAFMTAIPAQAQFQFGVKAGLNVTNAKFDKSIADADNRSGFFIGPMAEFSLPVFPLAIDAAILYNNTSIKAKGTVHVDGGYAQEYSDKKTLHYIDIPINLRYTIIGLPTVASFYVLAGPQFSYNIGSGKLFDNNYSLNSSDFSVNVGAGAKILGHVHVAYNYNIALGNTAEVKNDGALKTAWGELIGKDIKTNTHKISVAYLF